MTASPRGVRRAAAAALLVGATIGATLLPSTAAMAEPPELLVSDDGIVFAPDLTSGLFDGLGLLVPQESIAASLWVRNDSTTDASLRVSAAGLVTPSTLFAENVELTAESGGSSWTWTLAELGDCATVIPEMPVLAGETVRLDLTVSMLDLVGQQAQNESARLGLRLDARDAVSPFPSEPCSLPGGPDPSPDPGPNPGPGGGGLGATGALVYPFAGLGLALLAGGILVVVLRRRRRRDDDEEPA